MRVKEFCDIRMGHAFRKRLSNRPDGNVKVIQPKNISTDGDLSFKSGEPWRTDASASKPLEPGDVLVVNRGRFAATVFNPGDTGFWIVPSSILVLSVQDKSVLPEYVALYFNSPNGERLFRRHFEKTTAPFISARNLANTDIPVPSLYKQRALINFETTRREYARLANHKLELQRRILNYELQILNQLETR